MVPTSIKSRYFIQPKLIRNNMCTKENAVGVGGYAKLDNQPGLPLLKFLGLLGPSNAAKKDTGPCHSLVYTPLIQTKNSHQCGCILFLVCLFCTSQREFLVLVWVY